MGNVIVIIGLLVVCDLLLLCLGAVLGGVNELERDE